MFKYTFYDFSYGNYCLVLELNKTKIMLGSFFNENTIINMNNGQKNSNDMHSDCLLFTSNQEMLIKSIFLDLDIVIISDFSSMLGLPYILSKYNIKTETITFLSTEPIMQLAKSYMCEFYTNFNSFLIQHTISDNKDNSNMTLITQNDIDTYMSLFTHLAFNERYNSLIKKLDPAIIITFASSGYELGAFNTFIEYYNTTICILSHTSRIPNRYPFDFDYSLFSSLDYCIQFPNLINNTPLVSNYEKNLSQMISDITAIFSKSSVLSSHYPYIFLIAEPFFMFEFIDILRYKFPKDVKCVYISKSIDSLMKYSNINLSFINDKSYKKIYDFMSPLSYDDLQNKEVLYSFESFDDMLKNESFSKTITKSECPIMFIVNKMSFDLEENSIANLFDFFVNNTSGGNDYVITLNYLSPKLMKNVSIKQKNYIIDYNITKEQYLQLMQLLKPKQLFVMKNDKDNYGSAINCELSILEGINASSYEVNTGNIIDIVSNSLIYFNAYSLFEIKQSDDIAFDCQIENVKLLLSKMKKSSNKTSESSKSKQTSNKPRDVIDQFEELFKTYLECNQMTIVEFLYKENIIKISIAKSSNKQNESYAEIDITIDNNEPIIDISTDNYSNTLYLNSLLTAMFN